LDPTVIDRVEELLFKPLEDPTQAEPVDAVSQSQMIADAAKAEAAAWLEQLKKLSTFELRVYHWFITCHCSRKQTARECGIKSFSDLAVIFKAIGDKLGRSLSEIRQERDSAGVFQIERKRQDEFLRAKRAQA
jgi:hypothetical protein